MSVLFGTASAGVAKRQPEKAKAIRAKLVAGQGRGGLSGGRALEFFDRGFKALGGNTEELAGAPKLTAAQKKKRIAKKRTVGRRGSILTKRRQRLGEVSPNIRRARILSGETLG